MRLYVWFWLKTWKHSIYYFSSKSFYSCSVNKLNSTFSAFFLYPLQAQRKEVFLQERYSHYSLTDPYLALQRDFEGGVPGGDKERGPLGSSPISILEAVMAHCRKMQERMSAQLAAAESRQKRVSHCGGGDFCWWRRLELKTKIESAWPCDRETKTPPVRLLRKDLISHMRSNLFASAFLNQNSQPDTTVEAERLRMFTAGIDNNYCNLIGFLFCKQSLCRNALENWIYWNDYQLLHGVGTKWIKEQLAHLFIYGVASCSTAYCIISQTNVDIIHLEEVHELPIDKCHMISNHYRRETHRTVFPVLPDSYKVCVSKMPNGC